MDNSIFRKKNLENISSPDELNRYIKIARPSTWLVLIALVILVLGIFVWSVVGRLESTVPCVIVTESNQTFVCVDSKYIANPSQDLYLKLDNQKVAITLLDQNAWPVNGVLSDYAINVGGLSQDSYVYFFGPQINFGDGIRQAKIVTELVRPITFLF